VLVSFNVDPKEILHGKAEFWDEWRFNKKCSQILYNRILPP